MKTINTKTMKMMPVVCALGLAIAAPLAIADDGADTSDDVSAQHHRATGLVRTVVANTWRFRDIGKALQAGYQRATGCVSGQYGGAQGVHYVRFDLMGDGVVNPATPEVLLYEPTRDGGMRLVGAEYLTFKEAWHGAQGAATAPIVGGQQMFLIDEPNRFVIPPAYALRVWAFKRNPAGIFALSNDRVSCEYYDPADAS